MSPRVISPQQAAAFRLAVQHLADRLPKGALMDALTSSAYQNTPPGAAEISLYARVAQFAPEALNDALVTSKTLLQTWSLRGAPHIYRVSQAPYYSQGLLPKTEQELVGFIQGIQPALEISGMKAGQVVDLTIEAIQHVLDGRIIEGKKDLDRALSTWITAQLTEAQRSAWQQPSLYAKDQSLGEAMVSFALRIAALRGLICFAERQGQKPAFVRTDQWLGKPFSDTSDAAKNNAASAGLLRRYLSGCGPSNSQDFSAWAGIKLDQAKRIWELLAGDIIEVQLNGKTVWLLEQDLPRLEQPPQAAGARLLPAHDPYLQLRDHAVLIANPKIQRQLWRTAGSPGLILMDGQPAALWRMRKQGTAPSCRLIISVTLFAAVTASARGLIQEEALGIAAVRNCADAVVEYNT